jgi:hypothetical protein
MRAINDFEAISCLDKVTKIGDMGTGRIPHNESRRKMDCLCAVSLHFLHSIFNITTRAPIARGIPHNFNVHILVPAKCPFSVTQ